MLHTELVPAPGPQSKRLMVVLHGLGDSLEGYRWLPSALAFPWMNYLLVNAPDAYYGGYSWYDYMGDPAPGVRRSRELLFQLLDAQREGGFPTEQTVLFGFSQGCLMTIEMAARYPHLLAGCVGISGYAHQPDQLVKELSPVARQQRLLLTHGTEDPLIPIKLVRQHVEKLKASSLNIQWHEFVKEHTIAGMDELRVIREFVEHGCE